jgi:hypothetical protein
MTNVPRTPSCKVAASTRWGGWPSIPRTTVGRCVWCAVSPRTSALGRCPPPRCEGRRAKLVSDWADNTGGNQALPDAQLINAMRQRYIGAFVVATTTLCGGCEAPVELPPIHGLPGDPPLVRVAVQCDVPLPLIAELNWTLPATSIAEHPALVCTMVQALKSSMDRLHSPPRIESGDWQRVAYATFSVQPEPPQRDSAARRPRYALCAFVRGRSATFCIAMADSDGAEPQFFFSHVASF